MATAEPNPLIELDDIPPDDQATVAAEIRALMGRYRVSQSRLASATGFSSRGLSERLAGKTNFTIRELGRIARFFGKSLGDLVTPLVISTLASLYVTRTNRPPLDSATSVPLQLSLFDDYEIAGQTVVVASVQEPADQQLTVVHMEAA